MKLGDWFLSSKSSPKLCLSFSRGIFSQPCAICLLLEKAASKEFVNNHFDLQMCVSRCACPRQHGLVVERCQRLLDSPKGTFGVLNELASDFGPLGMGYKTYCAFPILLLSWFWAMLICPCVTMKAFSVLALHPATSSPVSFDIFQSSAPLWR